MRKNDRFCAVVVTVLVASLGAWPAAAEVRAGPQVTAGRSSGGGRMHRLRPRGIKDRMALRRLEARLPGSLQKSVRRLRRAQALGLVTKFGGLPLVMTGTGGPVLAAGSHFGLSSMGSWLGTGAGKMRRTVVVGHAIRRVDLRDMVPARILATVQTDLNKAWIKTSEQVKKLETKKQTIHRQRELLLPRKGTFRRGKGTSGVWRRLARVTSKISKLEGQLARQKKAERWLVKELDAVMKETGRRLGKGGSP